MSDNDGGATEGVVIVDDSDGDDDDNDNIILPWWHSRCRFMSHAPFFPTLCGFPFLSSPISRPYTNMFLGVLPAYILSWQLNPP